MNAVRNHPDAIGRSFDRDLHEALKERRDVVVEDRREPLGGEWPRAELTRPPPRRPLPPRCPAPRSCR